MTSRPLMTLQVVVPPAQKLGAVPHGTRAIAPITGGTFEGPRLRGKVLPGGGDWTLLRSDGVLELDLRITLETDDGALIYMASFGLRHGPPEVLAALARGESVDPSTYYFLTAPRFETSAPQYAFLNRLIAFSSGDRRASGPIYTINEILLGQTTHGRSPQRRAQGSSCVRGCRCHECPDRMRVWCPCLRSRSQHERGRDRHELATADDGENSRSTAAKARCGVPWRS